MKNIYLILIAVLLTVSTGCLKRSGIKQENGVVVEKQYVPDTQDTDIGTGFTSSGQMIMTTHTTGGPEKFMVIFKCDHGSIFAVSKPDLYGSLEKGDKVQIMYYDLVNGDGETKDYEFVDAYRIIDFSEQDKPQLIRK